MIRSKTPKTKQDNPPPEKVEHTFYLGNRGNHTVWQPWGQCTCGVTIDEPHLIVEHVETHQANINNRNAYTMLKYILQEDA